MKNNELNTIIKKRPKIVYDINKKVNKWPANETCTSRG